MEVEEEGEGEGEEGGVGSRVGGQDEGVSKKKARVIAVKTDGEGGEMSGTRVSDTSDTRHTTRSQPPPTVTREPEQPEMKMSVSKAFPEVRGHTSYLTFAVFFPPCMTGTSVSVDGSCSVSVEGTPEVVMEDIDNIGVSGDDTGVVG